jgi:Ca2+-binding EF-hand superfamily protein
MQRPKFERVLRAIGLRCLGKAQVEAICKSFEAATTEAEGEYGWEGEEEKRMDYQKFVKWLEDGLERALNRVEEAADKAESETESQNEFTRKWKGMLGDGYDGDGDDDGEKSRAKPGSKSKYGGAVRFRGVGFPDFEEAAAMARLREGVRLAAERVREAQGAAAVGIGRRGGVRGDSHFFGRMLQDHATDEATAKGRKSNVVTVAELRECINSLDIRPKLNEAEFRTIVKAAREEDSDDSGGGDDGDDSSDEDESWRRARSRRKELQSNVRYDVLMDKLDSRGRESVNGYWRQQQGGGMMDADTNDSDGIGGSTDEEEEEARLREKRERERRRMQRRRERKWQSQGIMSKMDADEEGDEGDGNKSVRFSSGLELELGLDETYGTYHGHNNDTTIKSEGLNASITRSYNVNHRRERSGRLHTRVRARVMAALAARCSDGGATGMDDGAAGLDAVSLRQAFVEYDPRASGLVSVEDFVSVVSSLSSHAVSLRPDSSDMDELLRAFIEPGTGSSRSRSYHRGSKGRARGAIVPLVDYESFCRAVSLDDSELEDALSRVGKRINELRSLGVDVAAEYVVWDTDQSGFVARLHFERVCKELGMPMSTTELAGLMERYSTSAQGRASRGWQQINFRQFLREAGRPWRWRHDAGFGDGFTTMGVGLRGANAAGAGHDGTPFGRGGREGGSRGNNGAQSVMPPPDFMTGPDPPTPRQLDAWLGHAPTRAELGHYHAIHRPPLSEEGNAIWRLTKEGKALDGSIRRHADTHDAHHAAAAHPAAAASTGGLGYGAENASDVRYVRHGQGGHTSAKNGVVGVSVAGSRVRDERNGGGGNAWSEYRSAVSGCIREKRERLGVEQIERVQRRKERQVRRDREEEDERRNRRLAGHESDDSDSQRGRGRGRGRGSGRGGGSSSDEGGGRSGGGRGGRGRGQGRGSDSDSDSGRGRRK